MPRLLCDRRRKTLAAILRVPATFCRCSSNAWPLPPASAHLPAARRHPVAPLAFKGQFTNTAMPSPSPLCQQGPAAAGAGVGNQGRAGFVEIHRTLQDGEVMRRGANFAGGPSGRPIIRERGGCTSLPILPWTYLTTPHSRAIARTALAPHNIRRLAAGAHRTRRGVPGQAVSLPSRMGKKIFGVMEQTDVQRGQP